MTDTVTDPSGDLTAERIRDILKEAVGEERAAMRDEVIALVQEERAKGVEGNPEAVADYTKHALGTAGSDNDRVNVQALSRGAMQAKSIAPLALAFMTRAIASGGRSLETMKVWAGSKIDEIEKSGAVKAPHFDRVVKGLSGLTFAAGGALIPEDMAAELIEALRASSIMRQMGVRTIDMPTGSLRIGRVKVAASPTATQEGTGPNADGYTFEDVVLNAKKLMTIVPITKDLLEQSNATVDAFVAEDMQEAMRVQEDLQLIRGSGLGNEHLGLFNIMKQYFPANALTQSGTTIADVVGDLRLLMTGPRTNKVPERDPGFLWNHRSKIFAQTLLDANGHHVFRDEIDGGMLYGYKYGTTENIPQNLGTGPSNKSEIGFTDFGHLVIGDTRKLRVEVVDGAAYKSEGGAIVSAFTDDEVVAKTSLKSGFNSRHLGRETMLLEGVTWGV